MGKHRATSKQSYVPGASALALETKIEIVRVQLESLERKVDEGLGESRRWREELRARDEAVRTELAATRGSTVEKIESEVAKHVVQDDHFHAAIEMRVERVENQGLEHGRMMVQRLELLEKKDSADSAVDAYKRWLVVAILFGGVALLLNALRLFEPFVQYFLRSGVPLR